MISEKDSKPRLSRQLGQAEGNQWMDLPRSVNPLFGENMATVDKIVSDFRTIQSSAMGAVKRLNREDSWSAKTKAREIQDAVHRLALLIMKRHEVDGFAEDDSSIKLDPSQVKSTKDGNLDGLEAMLRCKVRVLKTWTSHGDITYGDYDVEHEAYRPQASIRVALNGSRNNIFYWIEPTLGPLWGESDALTQVEKEIFPGRE